MAYKRQRDIDVKIQREETERKIIEREEEGKRAYEEERLERSRRLEQQTREI